MEDTRFVKKILPHYYGNVVRMLFMFAAIIMLTTLPIFNQHLGLPTIFSIISILILGLTAGLTNPLLFWDAWVNVFISCIGFIAVTAYAVKAYGQDLPIFLLTNVILSFIFMLAVYLSVKTLRTFVLAKKEEI